MKFSLFIAIFCISFVFFAPIQAANTTPSNQVKIQKSSTGSISKSSTGAIKTPQNTVKPKKITPKTWTGTVKTGTGGIKTWTGSVKTWTGITKTWTGSVKTATGTIKEKTATDTKNIIEILEAEGNFKTLLAAIKKAELTEGIKTKGPFTLFAPNDAAFAKVPKETLDFVMKDKEFLTHILKYHVLWAVLETKDMSQYANAKTAQGSNLPIDTTSGAPKIDGASIIKADIKSKNGIIHVIDSVLMPPIHQ